MTTPPEPPPAPSSPPPSAGWGLPAVSPVERVRVAWQGRATSDYLFVNPVLNVVLMVLTCGIYGFYLFYQLIRRSRDHNRRRLELLDAATTFAWEDAHRKGIAEELRPAFERIAVQLETLRRMTTDFRDPAIWVVIAIFANGIAQLVAFVLLDGDLIRHDRAEGAVEAELAAIYARLGQPLPVPDPARVKSPDNYVGRIIATIASCGFYTLWWWCDMQRVGDQHFAVNWTWEYHLAQAVQQLSDAA